MGRILPTLALVSLLWACSGRSVGLPELAQQSAERYLRAWQASDWDLIYRFEGQTPRSRSVFHRALSDRLEFFHISEVRYADSAVACAVTLRWQTPAGTYSETGELYLKRVGTDWLVSGYRNF